MACQVAIAERFVLMFVDSLVVQHRVQLQKAQLEAGTVPVWLEFNDQRTAKPLSRQRLIEDTWVQGNCSTKKKKK